MDASAAGNLSFALEKHRSGCALVRITGDLDACAAAQVEEALAPRLQGSQEPLVLDLGALEFIDSTGIRLLLTLMSRRGGRDRVTLVRPRSNIARRALELVGFSRVIPMVDQLPDALRQDAAGGGA